MGDQFEEVLEYLSRRQGFDFSESRRGSLQAVVEKRMADKEIGDAKTYIRRLENDSEERIGLMDRLTVNVSRFFRNGLTFSYLAERVLPEMVSEKIRREDRSLRVWSAGCAGGEEPYSVAILLREIMEKEKAGMEVDIFGTDISRSVLGKAEEGVYCFDQVRDVGYGILRRYFTQKNDSYLLAPEIKKMVNFSYYDMVDPKTYVPPESVFGNFDLVLCRNLLIYFRSERQALIFNKLTRSLAGGGYLVLGEAERPTRGTAGRFREENDYCRIYRKRC